MMLNKLEYDMLNKFCKDFIDDKCIVRKNMMPGKSPGTTYTWMFYLRRGLFNAEFSHALSLLFLSKIEKEVGHFDFQIAGLETASTPLLAVIPIVAKTQKISLNAFSIRKEQKSYGLLNWIEGIPNKKPVMLIDDLCNSSTSMKIAHDILTKKHEGFKMFNYAYSIVNKVNKQIHPLKRQKTDMYLPTDIKMIYQYDMDDFDLDNPSH